MSATSKYTPLAVLLAANGADAIQMTFAEVDKVVAGGLPASAYRYRTWWTRYGGNSAQSHSGWIVAGYRVSGVDLTSRRVIFTKA